MKLLFSFLFLMISLMGAAQQAGEIALIPQPAILEKKGGVFELNSYSVIEVPDKTADVQMVARYLAQQVLRATAYPLPRTPEVQQLPFL